MRPSLSRRLPANPQRLAAASLAALLSSCALPAIYKGAPAPLSPGWETRGERRNPLVGRIWDVRADRFIDAAALEAAVAKAGLLFLGEIHDNPDQHRLQARLVRTLTAADRRPILAFEMLDTSQQEAVDAARARSPRDPNAIAEAVGWKKSGWPDFAIYRPIFEAGAQANLTILAANLSRKDGKEIVSKGDEAVPPELRAMLAREEPISDEVMRALREEMREAHCGHLPEKLLDPMVLAQRARDARMAERLLNAAGPQGAILITGVGHVRRDRGVPAHVARQEPERRIVAVAMLEASEGHILPGAYAEEFGPGELPFDFVLWTPRAEREDPCEGLRKHLEKVKAKTAAAAR